MRIKSYFAASVQAAIVMARQEFGDEVTLVTSHIAGPDARHLGQYEVVFAVEEPPAATAEPERETLPEPTPWSEFQQLLLNAVQAKPAASDEVPEKLDHIRCALIDLGLEAATASAVMTLIEKSLPAALPLAVSIREERTSRAPKELAPVVSIESRRYSRLSAAELSFISSVAESPMPAAVQNR